MWLLIDPSAVRCLPVIPDCHPLCVGSTAAAGAGVEPGDAAVGAGQQLEQRAGAWNKEPVITVDLGIATLVVHVALKDRL